MKRREIYLLLAICGVFLCLESLSYASPKKTIRFHVVITDRCNNDFSRHLLESVKKAINGKIFVLTKKFGVVSKDIADHEKMAINKNSALHEVITDSVDPEPGDEKLTMRFNRPNAEGLYNADLLNFMYQRDRTWIRGFNPGNFRFNKEMSDLELRERLIDLLVRLPFK